MEKSAVKSDAADFAPAFFCLALVLANHSIFRLGSLPLLWSVALILAVAAVAVLAPTIEFKSRYVSSLRPVNLVAGLVLLAPLAASILLGWNREFPFHGDHAFHNRQTRFLAHWLLAPVGSPPFSFALPSSPIQLLECRGVIFVFALAIIAGCYRRYRVAALIVAAVCFVSWGLFEHSIYYRYPAAGYFLSIPFLPFAYLAGNMELVGRLTSGAAPLAWLFLLRPLFLGRWPDLKILPVAVFVLWQQDVLYFFDSSYLEPWAVVFLLLAAELLIARGRDGAPLACLLVGLAAAVKEPPILALPFVWLAGEPWRGSWRERAKLTGSGLAAGFPFLLYLAARKSLTVEEMEYDRPWVPSLAHLGAYIEEYIHRMSISFNGSGRVVAVFALAAIPVVLLWPKFRSRIQVAILTAAGMAIMLFFAVDSESLWGAGEFRFFLYSLPMLSAGIMAIGYIWNPKVLSAVALVALALQIPGVVVAVNRSAGPTLMRNFVENHTSPIVFPLKSLLTEARQKRLLQSDSTILANEFAGGRIPGIDEVTFGATGELYCDCTAEHPNVLALFVEYTNLNAGLLERPRGIFGPYPSLDALWRQQLAARPICLIKLAQSCGHVLKRIEQGETIAVLGIR